MKTNASCFGREMTTAMRNWMKGARQAANITVVTTRFKGKSVSVVQFKVSKLLETYNVVAED